MVPCTVTLFQAAPTAIDDAKGEGEVMHGESPADVQFCAKLLRSCPLGWCDPRLGGRIIQPCSLFAVGGGIPSSNSGCTHAGSAAQCLY